jgi:hypothetical protein
MPRNAISSCKHHTVCLHKPRECSLLHTYTIWYSLLLLGYKPVEHVFVLNIVHQSFGSLIRVQVTHHHNNLSNKPNWSIYNINHLFKSISGYTKLLLTPQSTYVLIILPVLPNLEPTVAKYVYSNSGCMALASPTVDSGWFKWYDQSEWSRTRLRHRLQGAKRERDKRV